MSDFVWREDDYMYTYSRPVTYSEIGHTQNVDAAQLIRYFQDCSTFQSESLGVGIQFQEEHGYGWILTAWQVIIDRSPVLGEKITTGTWASGFDTMYGYRNFVLENETGQRLVKANSIWVLADIKTGRPVKLKDDYVSPYPVEEKIDIEYAPRRIRLPKEWIRKESFAVRKSDLDTNKHVNNANYVSMALEYVPEDFDIDQMRVEYKKSAVYGDCIYPLLHIEETKIIVALADQDDLVYAAVELSKKP